MIEFAISSKMAFLQSQTYHLDTITIEISFC